MEKQHGNRLIAEFMGYYQQWKQSHPEETPDENFHYHHSWDWLMPVVEKIASIEITPPPNYRGYRMEIVPNGYVKIEGFPMTTIFKNVSVAGSLRVAIWQACVEFILWHNSQK